MSIMKNIKLTTTNDNEAVFNWYNVDFVKTTATTFGDEYTEVHCGKTIIGVKESLAEIQTKLEQDNA